MNALEAAIWTDVFRRAPILNLFPGLFRSDKIVEDRKEHYKLASERVQKRIARGNDRDDFFGHLLGEKSTDLTPRFLTAQATVLVVAGSETTATFLTGMHIPITLP